MAVKKAVPEASLPKVEGTIGKVFKIVVRVMSGKYYENVSEYALMNITEKSYVVKSGEGRASIPKDKLECPSVRRSSHDWVTVTNYIVEETLIGHYTEQAKQILNDDLLKMQEELQAALDAVRNS